MMASIKNELSPEQLRAVDLIVSKGATGARFSEIAETVGVSERTLLRWRQTPEFREEVRKRTLELNGEHLSKVLESLVKRAVAGNVRAIELYLKLEGLLKQNSSDQTQPVQKARPTQEELDAEIAKLELELAEFEEYEKRRDQDHVC
jgi:transposase-like protein